MTDPGVPNLAEPAASPCRFAAFSSSRVECDGEVVDGACRSHVAGPAAQQPLSRSAEPLIDAERAVAYALQPFREVLDEEFRRVLTRTTVAALDLPARDARVRADERRRVLAEVADVLSDGPRYMDWCRVHRNVYSYGTNEVVHAALYIQSVMGAAPAEGAQERAAGTGGTSERPDPVRLLSEFGADLNEEERRGFLVGLSPAHPEPQEGRTDAQP